MRKFIKPLMIAAALAASFSTVAVQKDITVNANVDAELDMTQADNTPLPASVDMQYLPGQGLQPYKLNTKIWSNDIAKDVQVRLVSAAQLANEAGTKQVPLTVVLGDKTLSTADTTYAAADLFPGTLENGSQILPLTFSQTTKGVLETGKYSGVVSLLLLQKTTGA